MSLLFLENMKLLATNQNFHSAHMRFQFSIASSVLFSELYKSSGLFFTIHVQEYSQDFREGFRKVQEEIHDILEIASKRMKT